MNHGVIPLLESPADGYSCTANYDSIETFGIVTRPANPATKTIFRLTFRLIQPYPKFSVAPQMKPKTSASDLLSAQAETAPSLPAALGCVHVA
jgi:hypothetical protein